VLSDRGLWDSPIPRPEETCRVFVCRRAIRRNSNSLHIEVIGSRSETNEERNKERKITKVIKLSVLMTNTKYNKVLNVPVP